MVSFGGQSPFCTRNISDDYGVLPQKFCLKDCEPEIVGNELTLFLFLCFLYVLQRLYILCPSAIFLQRLTEKLSPGAQTCNQHLEGEGRGCSAAATQP